MENELSKRLDRLVNFTAKLRDYQKRYFKYRASADLEKAKYYSRQVDEILKTELKLKQHEN